MPEPRKYTEAQKKSAKKWDAANLDRVSVAMPKGKKDAVKTAADAAGESMNQYIINAIDRRMEREHRRWPAEAPELAEGAGVVSLPSEREKARKTAQNNREEGST